MRGRRTRSSGKTAQAKSTLLKILAGILRPDSGELWWSDARLSLGSPREALERVS